MKNTENPTLYSLNTQNTSPETVQTFADVLKLLGVESLEIRPETQARAVRGTRELLADYGADWMRQNAERLIAELEYLDTM